MELNLTNRPTTGLVVSEELFGGNTLYARNTLEESGTFEDAVATLGVSGLRYPGGTMTESWGAEFIADPDSPPADFDWATSFVGLTEFLNWTVAHDQEATIVIPTSQILAGTIGTEDRVVDPDAVADVKAFVIKTLTENPDAVIKGFEIGNEYFGSVTDMTSTEYGRVADALAVAIQEAIDEVLGTGAVQPSIYVQMGETWGRDFDPGGVHDDPSLTWGQKMSLANSDILAELSDAARIAIDGVIEHYYYSDTDDELTIGDAGFYDTDLYFQEIYWDHQRWLQDFARGDYGVLEFVVTEWGPDHNNSAQFGLKSAGVMLEMFEALVRLGVDTAHVWPIELGGPTDLAGAHDGSDGINSDLLTPIGEAFRLMSEYTIGLELLNNGFDAEDAAVDTVEVNCYGSDDRFVAFISSRSDTTQEVTLDISAYVSRFESMSGEKIVLNDPDADPDQPWQFATTVGYTAAALGNSTTIEASLGAWEVLMVEFVLDPEVGLGSMPIEEGQTLYGNKFGNLINGGGGFDTILGRGGADTLSGWAGDDLLVGARGADKLYGNSGDDILRGNKGRDTLIGADGDDRLQGGRGADVLIGGDGNDVLIGGAGDVRDRLVAGDGNDLMKGGGGSDIFVLTSGDDRIRDFGRGRDYIDFTSLDIAFGDLTISKVSGGTLIDYGDGTVLLEGVATSSIDAGDFFF